MPPSNSGLAALIGSRICHDLISPIGAIGNGLELLQMTIGDSPEMELIADSVTNAQARIKFFRVAYGAASDTQAIGVIEIKTILSDLAKGGRVNFDWQPDADIQRSEVRLVFLALQCFESAMPHGGTVVIKKDGPSWMIEAQSGRFRIEPDLWGNLSLTQPSTDLAPAQLQFALLPVLLADAGRRLTARMSDSEVMLKF